MNWPSWRLIRVWQRNRDVFIRLWPSEVTGFFIEPVVLLLTMGFGLGAYVGMVNGQDYIEFVAPGVVASYAMFSASFECTYGSYFRMEYQKTFDAIIATPLSVEDVIAGEILWGATRATITGVVILAMAAAFGLVATPWALLIPVVVLLEGLAFSAISFAFTSFVPSIHSFNHYFSLFISPMFFFSGVFFPLTSFPAIVQNLSWLAPLTPAVKLVRASFTGQFDAQSLLAFAILAALTAVFLVISLIAMRRKLIV